jgi:hypothetical protein
MVSVRHFASMPLMVVAESAVPLKVQPRLEK